jgi:hypothetical protein
MWMLTRSWTLVWLSLLLEVEVGEQKEAQISVRVPIRRLFPGGQMRSGL